MGKRRAISSLAEVLPPSMNRAVACFERFDEGLKRQRLMPPVAALLQLHQHEEGARFGLAPPRPRRPYFVGRDLPSAPPRAWPREEPNPFPARSVWSNPRGTTEVEKQENALDGARDGHSGNLAASSAIRATSLRAALRNIGGLVIYEDTEMRVTWSENIPASWSEKNLTGHLGEDYLPPNEAVRMEKAKREVLATNSPKKLQISLSGGGEKRWFDVWIDADRADGDVRGLITTAIDITEQKRREQTLRTLLREVSHRSKNLLSIIQSVAIQTGRYSSGIDGFLMKFRGRIQSLASSQDLITSSNWHGADLHELVRGQLDRYCADPENNLRLEGENPYLTPNAALHVGLALHELAVNSVSYGALSKPDGSVTITAAKGGGENNSLTLLWSENVSVDIETLKSRQARFGSVLLEKVVPTSLNGAATLSIGAHGIEYRLTIPPENFDIE